MFVAGFAFHLAILARFEQHSTRPIEVRRRFRRVIDLIFIGYLLKVPYDALHQLSNIPESVLSEFLRCDVLQCIGVTLLILETLTVALKKPAHVAFAASMLTVALISIAPLTDSWFPEGPLHILLSYVSHRGGSLFPVVPWCGFMLAGCAIGYWAMPQSAATPWRVTLFRLAIVFTALSALQTGIAVLPSPFIRDQTHASSRPEFVLERMAAIVLATAGLCALATRIRRLPRILRILSGESLFVYVFHLGDRLQFTIRCISRRREEFILGSRFAGIRGYVGSLRNERAHLAPLQVLEDDPGARVLQGRRF